tara:strand:- start:871 stop:1017 length:147 start_codon:yes stop_codon:yes gene_type:complete
LKEVITLILAFLIGAACGWFKLVPPVPPHWMGILLIMLMYIGYTIFKR